MGSRIGISRIGRIVFGTLIAAVGVSLAAFMAAALLHEIVIGDFFGAAVSALVLTFGTQLTRIGWQMIRGASATSAEPQPTDSLWQSEARVYPHLPYSRLEIRGR
jgi:small neutral amino acid transporter SnatA (MarC family)